MKKAYPPKHTPRSRERQPTFTQLTDRSMLATFPDGSRYGVVFHKRLRDGKVVYRKQFFRLQEAPVESV